MTKYIAKTNNRTALFLSHFYATFEESVANINKIEHNRILTIKNDPISSQHILVIDSKNPNKNFRIEKRDIELANQNRQSLYHLLTNVFDDLKVHATPA
ncbi:hypothetical protein G9F31_01340 [Acinetobacter sp. 187]|uniref:hypothetical protein n=1 Tax=Acinetobacter lanii TaxID=2715163 RepID=UPI00140D91C4|nr:hypothetical protein [Acinetobacter lanii]NHC02428.1 hypothetical protein [Acinetobacter lanii]